MKKTSLVTFILLFIVQFNCVLGQVEINGLKGKNWSLSATQFEDNSYVVSCQHSSEATKIIFFNNEGVMTKSKVLSTNDAWAFSERPIKRYNTGMDIPIIDKKNKVCYNLIGTDKSLSVITINNDLEVQTTTTETKILKSFGGLHSGMFTEHDPIRSFDKNGNPFWVLSLNQQGVLWVNYNLSNKKIEFKHIEFEGHSIANAGVLGYLNEKVWYGHVSDPGDKKDFYVVSIYSIDENYVSKKEQDLKLKKSNKDIGGSICMTDQLTMNSKDKLFFTLSTQSKNNSTGATSIQFMSFDGLEFKSASWENTTGVLFYNATFMATETNDAETRFVLNDRIGNALSFDVDFNNESIDKVNGISGMPEQEDRMAYTFLVFNNLMDEEFKSQIGDFKKSGNTPLVFRGIGNNYFLIKAKYQEDKVSYTTQF
jgi:hypothetical protein